MKRVELARATIINEFGMMAYLRCVATSMFSRRKVSYLELMMRLPDGHRRHLAN